MLKIYLKGMRIPVLVLSLHLCCCTVLLAGSLNAQTISLDVRNESIVQVFRLIEKQSAVRFSYNDATIASLPAVSLKLSGKTVEEVLDELSRQVPLIFKQTGNLIGVQRKPASTTNNSSSAAITLQGIIRDEAGNPLPGTSVQVKDTNLTASTDENGRFQLTVPALPIALVVSYIGYTSQEITVRDAAQPVIIVLQPNATSLDEVVVSTGYQDIPKERATGSFVQIDNELLNRRVGTHILDRLDGITSGLIFNKSNINDESISIRGRSTLLTGDAAEPLIVLDNFPYSGDINNINPNDIESVTVLKDAAAASIWGARSGNGVIVITTKKGRINQPLRIEATSNVTISEKPDLFYSRNFLSSSDYIDVEQFLFDKGYFDARINNTTSWGAVSPVVEILAQKRSGALTDAQAQQQINQYRSLDVRNDFAEYIYQPQVNQQYALNFRGGGNKLAYTFSLGYDRNKEHQVRTGYDRFTFSTLNTFTPVKNLELTGGVTYTRSNRDNNRPFYYGSSATAFAPSYDLYPYARLADDQGNPVAIIKDYRPVYKNNTQQLGFMDWEYRPLDELALSDNTSASNNMLLKAIARYRFASFLQAELQYQNEREIGSSRNYQSPDSYFVRNWVNRFSQRNAATGAFAYPYPKGAVLDLSNNELNAHNVRGQLNFNRVFASNHAVNAIAGAEAREITAERYTRRSYGYDDALGTAVTNMNFQSSFPVQPSGNLTLPTADGSVNGTVNRFISYYANAGYTYKKRYTATLSGRKDGANIFGIRTNQKITPLWSAGISWDIGKEDFFNVKWLDHLKFRATYGYNGNVYNASSYLTALYLTSSLTGAQRAQIQQPPNPERKWERVKNINLALDLGLASKVLSGSVEWYQKDGIDLIEDAPLAPSTGFTTFKGNAASTRTRGMDLTLNSLNINTTIQWRSSFLFSYLKDKVTKFDTKYRATNLVSNQYGGLIAVTGRPLFGVYSYQWAGLDPATGDPQGYLDGTVSKDYPAILNAASPKNLVYHGSARPTLFGALRNTVNWKGFSVSANITYKLNYYFRRRSVSANYQDIVLSSAHADYAGRWQQPGDERRTSVPSLVYPNNNNRNNFYRSSETLVERADHIRLQDVQLSYDLLKAAWKNLPVERLQLSIYTNNLGVLWMANKAKLDPDYNDTQGGVETFPNPRTIAFSLRTNF